MTHRKKILDFLISDQNENKPFSPLILSRRLNIPNPSVRRELKGLLEDNLVKIHNKPNNPHHLDYYSSKMIVKDFIKKCKRQIQIIKARRKYEASGKRKKK